ncbi:MAG: YabP/YqfC family sporulation protein [Clostridia bacterium]|nr:YabP/YqfC family sporulation protein [Clostridia bacterium]
MILDETFIEIRGNRTLLVDGFSHLLDYSEDEILFNAGKKKLKISGTKLKMDMMTEGKIAVSGTISALEFLQ